MNSTSNVIISLVMMESSFCNSMTTTESNRMNIYFTLKITKWL